MRPLSHANIRFLPLSVPARPPRESRMDSVSVWMVDAALSPFSSRPAMGSPGYVRWVADIGLSDRDHVGGKGGSLGDLQRAGIPVPPRFVVRTQACEPFLHGWERQSPLRSQGSPLNPA